MITLPTNLQCISSAGYGVTLPSGKRYLGGVIDVGGSFPTITITILLSTQSIRNEFWDFWETGINYGTDKFIMPIDIFGYVEDVEVSIHSVKESRITLAASEVTFTALISNIEDIGI